MDTKEFLKLVVPSEGHICIADHLTFEDGKKAFVHYPFQDHGKAAWFAQKMDERGSVIYFALATYAETFQNKNDKTRIKRTQKNVALLKSIWLDIDFKDCGPEELKPKFAHFIKASGLPVPSLIVSSGGGWHVYWCLAEAVTPEQWVPLAEGLKQLCKDHDLPADHVCTSDMARVLRPVGTTNRKYDPPREVKVLAGNGVCFEYDTLLRAMPKIDKNALPAHLRGKGGVTNEYTETGFAPREVDTKQVVQNCAVLRHVLQTGGKFQSEPEWNATLLLLRFLPDGAKLVHPMSKGHIDYSPDATMQKWQEKLNADVSGPPLCSTLEQYGHTARCQTCPIYKSKKAKTPLALGYVSNQPTEDSQKNSQQIPGAPTPKPGRFVTPAHDYPSGWRAIPGNEGVEKKVFDKEAAEFVWEKVLRRAWRLSATQRSANTGEYTLIVGAKTITGKPIEFEIPGALAYGCPKTWEVLGSKGAILTAAEKPFWTDLMATWLQKLQEENAVLDTTDQLGWIERVDDAGNKSIVGFASGGAAFFSDGTRKTSVVTANHKHKGIADYYLPVGDKKRWSEVFEFYRTQGLEHVMVMLASAFGGPLVKFTGQSGAVMSIVSTGTSAGKSLSLEAAASVWGNPKLGTMTLNDTPTTVKNKVAYLQTLTAYWDEVRGDDRTMHEFIQTAFQITQGKDRERADRSARTIAAQTWHTMLVCTSNESVFDIAGSETGASDAGVYRIFEIFVPDDMRPKRDPRIASMVAELQNHYGGIGEQYAQYLAQHAGSVQKRTRTWLNKLEEHFKSEPSERFWIATMASLIAGAETANKAGVADFDLMSLVKYLQRQFKSLRARVLGSKSASDPNELLNLYMMQHMSERLVVDKLKIGRGGSYEPQIIGNPGNIRKVVYQVGKEQNILRVVKQDFVRWLWKTRQLRLSGELEVRFQRDCNMRAHKAILGAGTQFATSRAVCLDFDIDVEDIDIEDELNGDRGHD